MQAKAIIIKPVYTEKASSLNDKKVYAFIVNRKATKIDVKRALKEIYGAIITDVRALNYTSKSRKVRKGLMVKRSEGKKVYVTVAADSKLDLTANPKAKSFKAEKDVEIKVKSDKKENAEFDSKKTVSKSKSTKTSSSLSGKASSKTGRSTKSASKSK